MKTSKILLLVVVNATVAFVTLLLIRAAFPGRILHETGMLVAICLIVASGVVLMQVLMEWLTGGTAISWHWLKRNRMLEVLKRIDLGDKTYLVFEHMGKPRMYRFNLRLTDDITEGSTFVIQKNFGRPELLRQTEDGKYILNVIKPIQACL